MATITVADALARIDTYDRRIDKKQHWVTALLLREQRYRDPLAAEGGSAVVLAGELASIHALSEGKVLLRRRIQQAYADTFITFGEQTRSLADWLVWRREVSTRRAGFLEALSTRIQRARRQAMRRESQRSTRPGEGKVDIIVHLNEQELAEQREAIEELLGYLEGQLALKNATVTLEAPDEDLGLTGQEDRLEQLILQAAAASPLELTPPWSTSPELCTLASDPAQKISAIKLYRELTSAGLAEARDAVEAYVASLR